MAEHNMDHLNHLQAVADSDVEVLRKKEATYQGSWKRAGGRSAWFMARRNLDRLITMMAPPKATIRQEAFPFEDGKVTLTRKEFENLQALLRAEDIFLMIERDPSGADGTVLAVVRDARRYFTLVEAEMIARGYVETEEGAPVQVNLDTLDIVFDGPPGPEGGRFVEVENSKGQSVSVGQWLQRKDGYWALRIDVTTPERVVTGVRPEMVAPYGRSTLERASEIEADFYALKAQEWAVEPEQAAELVRLALEQYQGGAARVWGTTAPDPYHGGMAGLVGEVRVRTPEDGGQHAAAYPWVRPTPQDELWYRHHSIFCWVLHPFVVHGTIPSGLKDLYDDVLDGFLLKIGLCPPDARNMFPSLPMERNFVELRDAPAWQCDLYREEETKHVLINRAWHNPAEG